MGAPTTIGPGWPLAKEKLQGNKVFELDRNGQITTL
jgi:hypothetical protein